MRDFWPNSPRIRQNPKTADFRAPLGAFWGLLVLENQEVDGLDVYTVGFHENFDFDLGFAQVSLGPVLAGWVGQLADFSNKHEYLLALAVFARNQNWVDWIECESQVIDLKLALNTGKDSLRGWVEIEADDKTVFPNRGVGLVQNKDKRA